MDTMIALPNDWTLYSEGQRYTFGTYRELKEFSQNQADSRRLRFKQNVRPWLDYSSETKTITEYQY